MSEEFPEDMRGIIIITIYIIAMVLNAVNCSSMLNTPPVTERYDLLDWRTLTGVMSVNRRRW